MSGVCRADNARQKPKSATSTSAALKVTASNASSAVPRLPASSTHATNRCWFPNLIFRSSSGSLAMLAAMPGLVARELPKALLKLFREVPGYLSGALTKCRGGSAG